MVQPNISDRIQISTTTKFYATLNEHQNNEVDGI